MIIFIFSFSDKRPRTGKCSELVEMFHSDFKWNSYFLKKGMCRGWVTSQTFSTWFPSCQASGIENVSEDWTPRKDAKRWLTFRLLPAIALFLLRTQKGKCLQHRTWSSELILQHLLRLICTIVFGTDWFYYYYFLNHSCLFNFEGFPFMPGRLGNAVKCLICGSSIVDGKSRRSVQSMSLATFGSWWGDIDEIFSAPKKPG